MLEVPTDGMAEAESNTVKPGKYGKSKKKRTTRSKSKTHHAIAESNVHSESRESLEKSTNGTVSLTTKCAETSPLSLNPDHFQLLYKLRWPRTLFHSQSPSEQSTSCYHSFNSSAAMCRFFNRRPEPVESVAFTSDGLWLAAGRSDGQIDIYDVNGAILQMVRSTKGHVVKSNCTCFMQGRNLMR